MALTASRHSITLQSVLGSLPFFDLRSVSVPFSNVYFRYRLRTVLEHLYFRYRFRAVLEHLFPLPFLYDMATDISCEYGYDLP